MSGVNGPARGLAVYGGSAFLVYLETGGFHSDAPFLGTIPFLILSLLTLSTMMKSQVKYLTAASFVFIGAGHFFFTSNVASLSVASLLLTVSHCLYILGLKPFIKEWSLPILVLCCLTYLLVFFLCFSDLLVAIPTLVILISICIISALGLVVSSGSLLHYGSIGDVDDSKQLSLLRFVGALLDVLGLVLFVTNMFGRRTETINILYKLVFFIGQGFLFLANERAF